MAKRKAGSQTSIPDHKKLGNDSTLVRAGGVRHIIGKLSTRATTLLLISSQSEIWAKNYSSAKWREFEPWHSSLAVPRQKTIWVWVPRRGVENTILGKVVVSPESRPWWVLWIQSRSWLVITLKVFQKVNKQICWLVWYRFEWVTKSLSLFLVPSWSFNTPLYPLLMLRVRNVPRAPNNSDVYYLRPILGLSRSLGARQWWWFSWNFI
jgi:hypothetical protein